VNATAADPVAALLDRLEGAKPAGPGRWMARCPAHDDRSPSLSISTGDGGRALIHCHAGCSVADVCRALGIEQRDLFPPRDYGTNGRHKPAKRIAAQYNYVDAEGQLAYQVVRFEPKGFAQRRPDGGSGWLWSRNGTPPILYNLGRIIDAEPDATVYVCEGEKDCDALAALGLVATTNPGGAGKWVPVFSETLRGRRVVIPADNDKPGREHAQHVARSLQGIAAEVRILELPGLPDKGDVSDWLAGGGTAEQLADLAAAAPVWTPPENAPGPNLAQVPPAPAAAEDRSANSPTAGPKLVCLADVEPTAVKWLWPGRIPQGRITLVVGRPGEGKSFLSIDVAARVTTGTPFPDGSECPTGSVLFVCGEDDPHDTIRPRLDRAYADVSRVHLLSAVLRPGPDGDLREFMFTLADVRALEDALQRVPDCRLIVIDPIGSFLGGRTDAHRDNEVRGVLAPVAELAKRYGAAVLVIAHRRKSSGDTADDLALGSRAFTGIARAVWHVSPDRDNPERRLMLPGKNNLAKKGGGLAFTLIGDPVPTVSWEREPVNMNADDALAAERDDGTPGPEPEKRDQAADWLRDILADGPVKVADIQQAAKDAGLTFGGAVRRARQELGIKPYKGQFQDGWYWRLPEGVQTPAEDAQQSPREITCTPSGEPVHLRGFDHENGGESGGNGAVSRGGCTSSAGPFNDNGLRETPAEGAQVPVFPRTVPVETPVDGAFDE
jgi:putative DNA primase/helicase